MPRSAHKGHALLKHAVEEIGALENFPSLFQVREARDPIRMKRNLKRKEEDWNDARG